MVKLATLLTGLALVLPSVLAAALPVADNSLALAVGIDVAHRSEEPTSTGEGEYVGISNAELRSASAPAITQILEGYNFWEEAQEHPFTVNVAPAVRRSWTHLNWAVVRNGTDHVDHRINFHGDEGAQWVQVPYDFMSLDQKTVLATYVVYGFRSGEIVVTGNSSAENFFFDGYILSDDSSTPENGRTVTFENPDLLPSVQPTNSTNVS